ncbi:beta-ketoacyl synthase N-terminal-like domain-containing protein [Zunongwangia endophytica]|uniref:Beta-ketoacyl synthase N-terminal-like domain-containing protein n=1 Tax=Zunongwangia endophytica TaxID=1808945 RepID=A0ABV8H494_9FLAO|nr:beta-ketoacyl synthase N-terminal-like domain-containing protein [Zunongwangia endophytica]MDN3595638.1 beta-ketoacyl synthase N-terminal-like domain-containing protein [Zunongwangia endophytica]
MKNPIYITSMASVSPLGEDHSNIWEAYKTDQHFIKKHDFEGEDAFAASLPEDLNREIEKLRTESVNYRKLDRSVLMAIYVSRQAVKRAGWQNEKNIGINIGSSRGATGLFEKFHSEFIENRKASTQASPATTLGNISSWVGQDLENNGIHFSHSVTCSTGLHSVLNAVAWLQSGLADKFIAGASEAALTPFTIAQMKAIKTYASEDLEYPCQALNLNKTRNSMVLGEGAGLMCLENSVSERSLAKIIGIGYSAEKLKHSVSISDDGECMQNSMRMALGGLEPSEIDAVVMHAPGTIKGDAGEVKAIKALFGENLPAMTSNKWKIGHTFATSGILNLELAMLMLKKQQFISVPFSDISKKPTRIQNILVNAVGFGGNAVSILISKFNSLKKGK